MADETSLKFARVIFVIVKIIQLMCQIATVCFIESLKKFVSGKQRDRENISAMVNYAALASESFGIIFVLTMNLCPQTMLKAFYTEYMVAGVSGLCFVFTVVLSGSNLYEIKEQDVEFLNVRGYNESVILLLFAALGCKVFSVATVLRQRYLLRRNLNNMQVQRGANNMQVLGNEVSTANVVPPSFNEILPVNVDSPPPCLWVICECIALGFLHFGTIATRLINRIRNFNFPFFRSNRFNTTQENLCIDDASQFEADPSLEVSSPEVDFSLASLEFMQATTSPDQDQARGISLREEPSEAISGKEASKAISKENTSGETSLPQKTSKKSLEESDRKTRRNQEDERTETDLTKPGEDKKDNSSLETESSSDQ